MLGFGVLGTGQLDAIVYDPNTTLSTSQNQSQPRRFLSRFACPSTVHRDGKLMKRTRILR